MSECRSCGAKIIWIRMQSGKAMPCNPLRIGYTEQPEQPDSVKAVLTLITPDGRTVRGTYEPGNQQGNGRQIMQTVRQKTREKNTRIEEMRFSFRTYNCLRRAGIGTLAEIAARTPDEIMQIRGLGRRSFDEIRAKLEEYGATLKGET